MGTWSPRGGKAPTTGATTKVPLRSPEGRRGHTTARSLAVAAQNGTLRAFFVASRRVWPTETEVLGLVWPGGCGESKSPGAPLRGAKRARRRKTDSLVDASAGAFPGRYAVTEWPRCVAGGHCVPGDVGVRAPLREYWKSPERCWCFSSLSFTE